MDAASTKAARALFDKFLGSAQVFTNRSRLMRECEKVEQPSCELGLTNVGRALDPLTAVQIIHSGEIVILHRHVPCTVMAWAT